MQTPTVNEVFGDALPDWELACSTLRWHHLQWAVQRGGHDVAGAFAVYGVTDPARVAYQTFRLFHLPNPVLPIEPSARDALFEALIGDTPMTLDDARNAAERWYLHGVFARLGARMMDVCNTLRVRGYMVAQLAKRLGEPPGYVEKSWGIGWEP